MKRDKRQQKGGKEDEVYQLALKLQPAPPKGAKRAARASQMKGNIRPTIKKRLATDVREENPQPIGESMPQEPIAACAATEPAKPVPKRLRTYSKTRSCASASITALLVMSPERLHPLLEAAEAQLKVVRVPAAAPKKKRGANTRPIAAPDESSEFAGGWKVQTTARKTNGQMYKVWWSPPGKMHRTKGKAITAGFVSK